MSATFTQLTTRRGLSRAVIASAILASAVVVWGGYTGHWSWTGLTQNGTLWDWLKLLALPLSLAALLVAEQEAERPGGRCFGGLILSRVLE